jgi:putative colanic acid biosynthesis acetyltransferase WcaF
VAVSDPAPADPDARHVSPYRFGEKVRRIIWSCVEATLYRWSWPTWYGFRVVLLRAFGANVDRSARLRRTCRFFCPWNVSIGAHTATGEGVWFYAVGQIIIGQRVTLSHDCVLCAGSHDYRDVQNMPLQRLPIRIGDDTWIATGAFVGPDVTVGEGAILGARGVAFGDLEPWQIYVGNPAGHLKARDTMTSRTTPMEPQP